MQDLFFVRDFSYSIRNSENILQFPKPRTYYLMGSFGYSRADIWNGLASELRNPLTFKRFRKEKRAYIHQRALTRQASIPLF